MTHTTSTTSAQTHVRDVPGVPAAHATGPTALARLHHYFERTCDARPTARALECDGESLSYQALDEWANRLAHHLLDGGLRPGARVGILVPRSVPMYVSVLAVLKSGATFVPIDPAAPAERVAYIAEDSDLELMLTTSAHLETCAELAVPVVALDRAAGAVAVRPDVRPTVSTSGDPTSYIIYTSGSSGRPKGVEIAESSICNFINIVPPLYGVKPSDRVYQGMTIAFDFSIEEIWPTWAVGATLVAGPTDARRVGPGLADFLEDSAITMIYCVPTVLATLDRTIPSIRTVNVGGEACPQELVERWGGEGRRILNTYGPTETTVTCTWADLHVGHPVTIGWALPTYTVTLRDEDRTSVPFGEVGEICVSGPGVARGYVNRPDLTADRFVPDPDGPPGTRMYRTGDLGRFLPAGDIEYLGRADSEVKVRGNRVDLQEIESVILGDDHVSAAVVTLLPATESGGELAGYLLLAEGAPRDGDLIARLHAELRRKVPPYMVPAYLEIVAEIPMLPSGKADRSRLPAPQGSRLVAGDHDYVAPETATEERVAAVWGDVLRLPGGSLSVEADFFDDLGGHSLLAATVVSRLRATESNAGLSIRDLYANPTVRTLARHQELSLLEHGGEPEQGPPPRPVPPTRWRVAAFALSQLSWVYSLLVFFMLPIGIVYSVHGGEPNLAMLEQLLVLFPLSYLFGRWVVPVVGVRLLARGVTPGTYPLWGSTHLRVWATQKAMVLSPLTMLSGSPWAASYLRLAGARVGDACHIGTAEIPLPHLVDLGDGATIGYASHLNAFEIADGTLTIGAITIADDAVVGANTVLEGPCVVGTGAILREQSLLQAGQRVPDATTWSGSPATALDSAGDPVFDLMTECSAAPRQWPVRLLPAFGAGLAFLELLPLLAMAPIVALVWWMLLTQGVVAALIATVLSGPVFVATTCTLIIGVRRLVLPATPVGIHHLRSQLGMEKWFGDKLLEQSLSLNNTLYATLYTPMWLRALGARVGSGAEVSTIANIDPDILTLEDGAFVADMASVGSATYCNGHVAFRPTTVGRRAFVGNASFIPSGTHLGDGSLIGVQSVPPVSGAVPGSSWLGSPAIYLPRREMYDEFTEAQTFRPSARQVRHRYVIELLRIVLPASMLGLSTFATLLAVSAIATTVPMYLLVLLTPLIALGASLALVLAVAALKWTVVGRYRRRVEPLWSGFVRRTEFVTGIYEAVAVPALLAVLAGTPLLAPLLRLFGARIGRRTLIDTTYITEFDLIEIGDDVTVGSHASLQTHLFEDRVMKMSTISLGAGASVGSRAVVLYDSALGEESTLAPLSLVMKGESLLPGTSWRGIPAGPAPRRTRVSPGTEQAGAVR
ncbi:Pls/PosA family non-ribosomal peptide synthetase [Georgenia faecalis]|uniref:Pls/PosA family non-ribosomal peptide synthetase n=1 Tax=Georgenia faecalis TaxID=2483799 RepID=A0ABV9D8E6_9MICO|nr:Pls/PosA family non-ribosomal peptide synthetase [Georgenia faecalis]